MMTTTDKVVDVEVVAYPYPYRVVVYLKLVELLEWLLGDTYVDMQAPYPSRSHIGTSDIIIANSSARTSTRLSKERLAMYAAVILRLRTSRAIGLALRGTGLDKRPLLCVTP
jgi:hypothetical protein